MNMLTAEVVSFLGSSKLDSRTGLIHSPVLISHTLHHPIHLVKPSLQLYCNIFLALPIPP